MADFFEDTAKRAGDAKLAANWVMGEVSGYLNREEKAFEALPVTATQLAGLIARIKDGTLSNKMAKEVFEAMCAQPDERASADRIIEEKGLRQISDSGAIDALVDEVLAANPRQVEDYRSGKEKAFNSLVGQVMKASRGKANPAQVNEVLRRKLAR
jgi:aspartyl-tRNA(Asn)/glutamyl-tRNA(Gln) amidotransferase subunit B